MAITISDLRILQLLTDPLIERVMRADGVDPAALEADLRSIADGLAGARAGQAPESVAQKSCPPGFAQCACASPG
jgi:hypothetical protein